MFRQSLAFYEAEAEKSEDLKYINKAIELMVFEILKLSPNTTNLFFDKVYGNFANRIEAIAAIKFEYGKSLNPYTVEELKKSYCELLALGKTASAFFVINKSFFMSTIHLNKMRAVLLKLLRIFEYSLMQLSNYKHAGKLKELHRSLQSQLIDFNLFLGDIHLLVDNYTAAKKKLPYGLRRSVHPKTNCCT